MTNEELLFQWIERFHALQRAQRCFVVADADEADAAWEEFSRCEEAITRLIMLTEQALSKRAA